MKQNKGVKKIIIFLIIVFFVISLIVQGIEENSDNFNKKDVFKIISSTENKDIENVLKTYAKKNNIDLQIDYAGTIEIMEKLNNKEDYDAVWCSNSIWLYMLDSSISIKNSKSTSINPVVFGIKKSKAQELGFIGKDVYTKDIVDAIKQNKLKFSMTSPTQTNTGATAYLGFISTLTDANEVLKEENLENVDLKEDLTQLYSGVERSSGDDEFLEEMFLNGNYEAVITYETSIININKQLESQGKEPLYVVYTRDGVSISDSPLAYIDNKNSKKAEEFEKIQNYVLSNEGQEELVKTGRRVWFGGVNSNVDKNVFNPNWGIDTTKYIVPVKYPSVSVIKKALEIYQTELRKPIHIVFCLDYSGSMSGKGNEQLTNAMDYILDKEKASKNLLQFSNKDKITLILFNSNIIGIYNTENGEVTEQLMKEIASTRVTGGTDIYAPAIEALNILSKEDLNKYTASIVLMTDGVSNVNRFSSLENEYKTLGKDIPIFSIMFGTASESQLKSIADLTNAKIFNGKTNLLEAFKKVRGYN